MGGKAGGTPEAVDACAREIYAEWAANQHFELYDDVPAVLQRLTGAGIRVGLISNSHRCLDSFQSHFELREFIAGGVVGGHTRDRAEVSFGRVRTCGPPADAVMVGTASSRISRRAEGRCAPFCCTGQACDAAGR
jgi:phosphoglycolate phosphatase-like HAD superfamily hydrolase